VVKAADGTIALHGVLYKPFDFDPEKTYPVAEFIYAGPFTLLHQRRYTVVPWRGGYAEALAHLGFITFVVDGRGTPERGKAFQDVVHSNFGRHEISDHAAALRQLAAERPYMDLDRVGIFGGSWGGYFTVRALLLEPELYKVGVASSPVYDLYDHGATGLEGYMPLLEEAPEAYAYASSLRLVDRLQGHLLMIHGTSDINSTLSTTMKMVHALMEAGKPYDLILLPGQPHRPFGKAADYRMEAHARYFVRHLLGMEIPGG
jgi:dipeptidyl aminopeptidase/acylaminoacyl peptidase